MNILNTIVCSGIEIETIIPELISTVVKLITIGIPIILIVMSMIDLTKAVMAQNDEHKEALKKLINRLKYGVLIFLIPAIVTFVLNLVITDRQTFACVDCFIRGNCSNSSELDSDSGNSSDKEDNSSEQENGSDKEDNSSEQENGSDKEDNSSEQENNNPTSIIISYPSDSVAVGETLKLQVQPDNLKNVTYTSSNEEILTVSKNGIVTGVNTGQAFVIVEADNAKSSELTINVVASDKQNVEVEKLDYDESSYDMVIGEQENYTPKITPSNADTSNITYTSSKPKVATIDSNGNVSAKSEGTTVITATSGDIKTSVEISVITENVEVPVKSIEIDSSIGLKVGQTKQLKPVIKPSDATNQNIEYSSDNTSVATVDSNGVITAVGVGQANIYAKVTSVDKVAISTVTVASNDILVEKINLKEKETTIKIGEDYEIKTTIKPSNATNKNLTYSSSNKKVATVSKDGVITGKKAGNATITIKSEDGNKSTKLKVEVVKSNKIHFIKTSASSDSILLESNGKYALIDAGRSSDYKVIRNYLEKLNVEKLDFLFLTHNHGDHVGSAYEIIKKYKPDTLYVKRYYPNDIKGTNGVYIKEECDKNMNRYNKYMKKANEVGTKIIYFDDQKEGYSIKLNDMKLKNYNLSNHLKQGSNYYRKASENINSVTTLITIGSLKTYLGSDLSYGSVADPIAKKVGKVHVYKVVHHAYNGNSEKALQTLNPEYSIITNTRAILKTKSSTVVPTITKYTKGGKIYYSCENTIVVDYTSGKIKITKK